MQKPEPPQYRSAGDIEVLHPELKKGCWLYLRCDGGDGLSVWSIEEAEMLIFALQEWIEYKRQLEKWERENKE
jgi:hypothetical protein